NTSPEAIRRGNEQLRELYQRQDQIERAREPERQHRQLENLEKSKQPPSAAKPKAAASALSPARALATPAGPPSSSLNPYTVYSANGGLNLTLDLDYHTFTIGKDQVRLRSYRANDEAPEVPVGPVIRCKAGDTLYITLNNRLPLNPAGD